MEDDPRVSVVVPVYNCLATLRRAFDSVFEQTLGLDAIEIVAVDDGSTDGSGEALEALAGEHPQMVVLHQANSGGPGAPRNVGIERARGEYLFFLDADDYFGPEALERVCAMADENGTDVVLGQCVGVNRRPPHFPHDVGRTSVQESPWVYDTLSPLKLFRRSLVERLGLRFVEGLASHEDQLFTAQAYFGADGLSVLADYDCYYWVDREDGTSSLQQGGAEDARYWPVIAEVMSFAGEQVGPGPVRDRLMQRHFRYEVFPRFGTRYLAKSEDARAATRAGAVPLVKAWYTPGVAEAFGPRARLLGHCLSQDLYEALDEIVPCGLDGVQPPTLVDKDRAFSAYPRFRDPAAGIPDSCYDVTDRLHMAAWLTGLGWAEDTLEIRGTAVISELDPAEQTVTILLRSKDEPPIERRFEAKRDEEGFQALLPADLGKGHWEVHVEVSAQEILQTRRLVAIEEEVEMPGLRLGPAGTMMSPFIALGHQSFTIRVAPASLGQLLTVEEVTWEAPARLKVRGHLPSALPAGHSVKAAVKLIRRGTDDARQAEATAACHPGRVEVAATLDLRKAAPGRWDPELELDVDGVRVRGRLPAPGDVEPPAPVRTGLRRARPYPTEAGRLSVEITPVDVVAKLRRISRRLRP